MENKRGCFKSFNSYFEKTLGQYMTTIFTKIIQREIPAEILLENDDVIVIKDIAPAAPIHLLIITKKVISSLQMLKEEESFLLGAIVKAAQEMARQLDITDYRLLTNNGSEAGQSVFHLHFHMLAGKKLTHVA
jgi:histidine triad (HIT) family protein